MRSPRVSDTECPFGPLSSLAAVSLESEKMPAARSSGATARSIVKNSKRRAKFEHAMKKREEELEAWFNTYDTKCVHEHESLVHALSIQ